MTRAVRCVFMGTAEFAVPSLRALVDAGLEVPLVVTQPDRPAGRGLRVHKAPVKECAETLGLTVVQPEKVNTPESLAQIAAAQPEAIVVAAFGQFLSRRLLDLPPLGCVNVHPSLLPKFRGAAPVQRVVMEGCSITGVTTMLLNERMDAGDLLLQSEVRIDEQDDAATLLIRLADVGADLLVETLGGLKQGTLQPRPQDEAQATYAPPLKKEEGVVDWTRPARQIHNLVRGTVLWPGAFASCHGRQLRIWKCRREETVSGPGGDPGRVVQIGKAEIGVLSGSGILFLHEVQEEGRKRMTAAEWARGTRVGLGSSFDLETA